MGAINSEYTGDVAITLDEDSIWNVAEDSYITAITDEDSKLTNINSNGFNIYYDADNEQNEWLDGKTIRVQGTPEK